MGVGVGGAHGPHFLHIALPCSSNSLPTHLLGELGGQGVGNRLLEVVKNDAALLNACQGQRGARGWGKAVARAEVSSLRRMPA